jgi:hypothetical protein
MTRNKARRIEKLRRKLERSQPGKVAPMAAERKLTEEQQGILDAFNAFDAKVKAMRCTVPTGAKIARAFGALAQVVDEAMQENARAERKLHAVVGGESEAEAPPSRFQDVTAEVSEETLAVAGVERKPEGGETIQ